MKNASTTSRNFVITTSIAAINMMVTDSTVGSQFMVPIFLDIETKDKLASTRLETRKSDE